jgi:two-component system OmpR family response regulator
VAICLTINGFSPERIHSSREALRRVDEQRPELIVLDVMIPDLDGFEVARRMRQSEGAGTQVPIIFLTARDATADKVSGLKLGVDDYVTKPFSIEELVERVKAVLSGPREAGPPSVASATATSSSTRTRERSGGRATRSSSRPPSSSCCRTSSPTPGAY